MKQIKSEIYRQNKLICERIFRDLIVVGDEFVLNIGDIEKFRAVFYTEALKLERRYSVKKTISGGETMYIIKLEGLNNYDKAFENIYTRKEIALPKQDYQKAKQIINILNVGEKTSLEVKDSKQFEKYLHLLAAIKTPKPKFSVNIEDINSPEITVTRIS